MSDKAHVEAQHARILGLEESMNRQRARIQKLQAALVEACHLIEDPENWTAEISRLCELAEDVADGGAR